VPRASTAKKATAKGKGEADRLPLSIRLKHKPTGKERSIGTGFAWDLFLFAGVFGVPLFWRRLPQWGAIMLVLWLLVVIDGAVRANAGTTQAVQLVLFLAFLAVQLWLGLYGNRLTVRNLLAHGWNIDQANDAGTKRVVARWGLAV
jgi:hypothetical protein